MGYVVTTDETLTTIANAIRARNGKTTTYKPSEMPAAIIENPKSTIASVLDRSITTFVDNELTTIGPHAFRDCTALTTVDLSKITFLDESAFDGCISLSTLILRNNTVCKLTSYSIADTAVVSTGYVYVPRALLTQYQSNYWWKGFGAKFRSIEDYPEITGG